MKEAHLRFAPIKLMEHADICCQFRADSFQLSFGADEHAYQAHSASATAIHPDGRGRERYQSWLAQRMQKFPGSCVHAWHRNAIVGQVELGPFREDPSIGYVNLFYLIPEYRGQGLGAQLEEYALAFFRHSGFRVARLSVSARNAPAMSFYLRLGWQDLGPRIGRSESHYMEKRLLNNA